jgi:hypothetical protein
VVAVSSNSTTSNGFPEREQMGLPQPTALSCGT